MKMLGIVTSGLAAAALALACSPEASVNAAPEADGASMSFRLSLPDPDFSGNSVRIVGQRGDDADAKYPCANAFDECFNFGVDPIEVTNLCPSSDFPSADWTFTYEIYSDIDCDDGPGDVINVTQTADVVPVENPFNFVCYDSNDLPTRSSPNQSVDEFLAPGENHNAIICLTENASKAWDFGVCVLVSENPLVLDCGCEPVAGACECAQTLAEGGAELPPACAFQDEPTSCLVECT